MSHLIVILLVMVTFLVGFILLLNIISNNYGIQTNILYITILISLFIIPCIFIDNFYDKDSYLDIDNNIDTMINNEYSDVGIISIATGGYNVHDLSTSLYENGMWRKKLYVYSDSCTPIENNTHSLKIKELVTSSLHSKLYKMDVLKNTTEKYVLFLDSDIYVNKPIIELFKKIGKWKNTCDAYMTYDLWYSTKFIVNGGIFLVKRGTSEKFLYMWKKLILDKNYNKNKDQPALKYLINNGLINVCMIPNDVVYYLPDKSTHFYKYKNAIFHHSLKFKKNVKKCN